MRIRFWALLALLLAFARPAGACDDIVDVTRVVGVAPDGRFLLRRLRSGGVSCSLESFELRDRNGELVAQYTDEPDDECAASFKVGGQPPLLPRPHENADNLGRRLEQALQLAPLAPVAVRLSVQQDLSERGACLQVFLIKRQGYVPIWEQAAAKLGQCLATRVSSSQSARSPLLFFDYSFRRGGGCSIEASGTHWLTPAELAAARRLHRGERQLAAGALTEAAASAEAALADSPTLMRARLLLARSLYRAQTPWSEASARLAGRYPPRSACREGTFLGWASRLGGDDFQAWNQDADFDSWLDAEYQRHEAAHGENEGVYVGWDRP